MARATPEIELTQGAEEFRLMAEYIPHLAWMARADGWIYWYNRRWYEYTGTTAEDMEGWGWQAVHDPEGLPKVLTRWQGSIRTGEPFEMTFPLRGGDGVFRPFLTRVVPFKDDRGTVLRWFGTNTDISEEVRTAAALVESERRFRIATAAVNGVLWTNSAVGEMDGEQPGWSEFTGQTWEEYRGQGWVSAVHPEDARATMEAWQQAVVEERLFAFEHRVRRYDGMYRLCSVRALPIPDARGVVREWVGVHTDITDDRATQQRLADTAAALQQQQELVEAGELNNSIGFWRYQPLTGELYLSSGSRHLQDLPATGTIPPEMVFAQMDQRDVGGVQTALAEAMTTDQYRVEYRTAAGEAQNQRWVLSVARVLRPDGAPPYFVGINLDITEQKRSAEALIRTEKLAVAGRLAATIAHEINNPLEAVTNLLYLLRGTPLDAEQQSYCETIGNELQRVSEIATHTLRFHRQSTAARTVRIDDLVHSVLRLFEARLRHRQISTVCKLMGAGEVYGFDGELRQVLANLVGNAIDAMTGAKEPQTLFLRTRRHGRYHAGGTGVSVTVADTGTGMSRQTLEHIFDPFFTTKGDVGTGLGLWVSSEIIKKHHGALRVRSSQAAGLHGTVFRLFLPAGA